VQPLLFVFADGRREGLLVHGVCSFLCAHDVNIYYYDEDVKRESIFSCYFF
jgi:hypothetical protein